MLYRHWDPWNELDRFFNDFGRTRRHLAAPAENGEKHLARADWRPAVNIEEDDNAVHLHADLPGLKKDDIEVRVENGVLTVSGERREERSVKEGRVHVEERRYGSFRRSFHVPDYVDTTKIKAKYEDGVLMLTLPKTEEARPKRLEVKVN